jgi:hypothetical protein
MLQQNKLIILHWLFTNEYKFLFDLNFGASSSDTIFPIYKIFKEINSNASLYWNKNFQEFANLPYVQESGSPLMDFEKAGDFILRFGASNWGLIAFLFWVTILEIIGYNLLFFLSRQSILLDSLVVIFNISIV